MTEPVSAQFSSNIQEFIQQITQGLDRLESLLGDAGSRFDRIDLGRGLANSLLTNLNTAGERAKTRATEIAEEIQARLNAATTRASGGKVSFGQAFQEQGGFPGGGTLAASSKISLDQQLKSIRNALEQSLTAIPQELASARPALVAIARDQARATIAAARQNEQAQAAALRASGPEGAALVGRSTLTQQGQRFIAGQLAGPDVNALSHGDLAASNQLFQQQLLQTLNTAEHSAMQQLSTITKSQLLAEAKDPNVPGTYFGTIGQGTKTFSGTSPITRTDAGGRAVTFGPVPNLTADNQDEQAVILNAQRQAAAENANVVAAERTLEQQQKLGQAMADSVVAAQRQSQLLRSAALSAQGQAELGQRLQRELVSGQARQVRGGVLSRDVFYQGDATRGYTLNADPAATMAARSDVAKQELTAVAKLELEENKLAVALEQQRIRQEQFGKGMTGQLTPLGSAANPRYWQDRQTGTFLRPGSNVPLDPANPADNEDVYRARLAQQDLSLRQQAQLRRAQQQQAAAEPLGPGKAFLGGLTSRGFEAPGTGLVSLFGTAGVLTRYGAAGAAIGGLFRSLQELKAGVIDVDVAMTELSIAEKDTGGTSVNLSQAWGNLASEGIDVTEAIDVGAQALIIYQNEIHSSDDATRIFNDTIQNTAVLATNAGIEVRKAGQLLEQATNGFQLGSAGQARINDAISNARANFGGNAGEIATALANSADVAREGGVSPEQAANIFSLLNAHTGASGTSLASSLERLVSRSGNQTFVQALGTQGITNTGNVVTEIEQLSAAYQKMTPAARAAFENQLGGARAIQFMIPLLEAGTKLGDANAKSLDGQGRASEDFAHRIGNLQGILKQIGAVVKDIFANIGRSGIFAGFEAGILALKPVLELLNAMLNTLNRIPAIARDAVGGLLDLAIAYKIITSFRNNAFENIPGVRRIGGRSAAAIAGRAANEEAAAGTAAGVGARGTAAAGVAEGGAEIAAAEQQVATEQEVMAALFQQNNIKLLESMNAQIAMLEASTTEEAAARDAQLVVLRDGAAQLATSIEAAAAEITAAGEAAATEIIAGGAIGGAAGASRGLFGSRLGAGFLGRTGGVGGFLGRNVGPRYLAADLNIAAASRPALLGGETAGLLAGTGAAARLGAAAILPYGLAALAGYASFSAANSARQKIQGAESAGITAATANPQSVDDLRSSAANLKQASDNLGKASGGVLGTIMGGAGELLGYISNRGAERNFLNRTSAAQASEADAIDAARKAGGGSTIDLSNQQNLNDSLSAMVEKGATAADIIKSLNDALDQMNKTAATGVYTLQPSDSGHEGQAALLAATASSLTTRSVVSNAAGFRNKADFGDPSAEVLDLVQQRISNIDQKKLSTDLRRDLQDKLQKTGAYQGKPIDREALTKYAQQDLIAELKKQGIEFGNLPAVVQSELLSAAQYGIKVGLQNVTGGRKGPSAKEIENAIDEVIKNAPAVAQLEQVAYQANGDINTAFKKAILGQAHAGGLQLTTASSLESSQTAGLSAEHDTLTHSRDVIQQTIKNLQGQQKKSPTDNRKKEISDDQKKLAQLQVLIESNSAELQTSVVADIGAKGDLAVSALSEFDKGGRIKQQISTVESQIKAAPPDALPGLFKSLNDLKQAAADQALTDANAVRDAAVEPGDTLGAAQAQVQDAWASLADGIRRGATGGELAKLQRNVKDVTYQSAQTSVGFTNAQRTANQAGSSDLAGAATDIENTKAVLGTLSKKDQAYWQTLAQLHQQEVAYAALFLPMISTAEQLGEDITNPVVMARQAVRDAQRKLNSDRALGRDSSVLQPDQLALNKATNDERKATVDQQIQDAQTDFDLHRTSSAQYIGLLRKIRASITGSSRQAKDLRDAIDKDIQSANASLEGQFNLGDVKVPTVYEVRRAVSSAKAGVGMTQNVVSNITINGIDSTAAIIQVVRQQLGTSATVTRTPTTVPRA